MANLFIDMGLIFTDICTDSNFDNFIVQLPVLISHVFVGPMYHVLNFDLKL